MNVTEVLAAWQEAQACTTHDFYTRFFHLTGVSETNVKRHFGQWNRVRHEQAVAIAERHGVSVQEGGFQAYLSEVFWPTDSEQALLRQVARYLRGQLVEDGVITIEGAAQLVDSIADCQVRLGRRPLGFEILAGGLVGHGDPREHKDWPPEEDCPGCSSGRVGLGEGHKMSCSEDGAWQLVTPARMDEAGKLHVDILTPKD